MAKEKLPRLTEANVRALANEKSFARGEDYYDNDAVSETVRQGMQLRGECEGSDYEPYQITVTLNAKGVANTSCTCPYDYDGICKHLVALLLAYVHQPQTFRTVAPIEEMLKERSKEELIALIGEMSKQDPKLMPLVEIASAQQDAKAGKAVDLAAIRKKARRALQYDDFEYGSWRLIEKELRSLGAIATHFFKAGDWLNAGAVYYTLLDESVKGYDEMMQQIDEDGDLAVVVDEFTEALGKCLEKSKADSATRRDWLSVLLDGYSKDIEIGGMDFASNARDIIIKQADKAEWAWVEERIRSRITSTRDWAHEQYVEFLSDGLKRRGKAGKADKLIREIGTPEQQAQLLIKEGRIDDAERMLNEFVKGKPGLVTRFADWFLAVKAKDVALRFVMTHATAGWREDEWLAAYHRKYGTPQEALDGQKRLFLNHPSVEKFKILRDVCRKTKNWETIRAEVLATLEGAKKFAPLIEIALHEGNVTRALQLLPQVSSWGASDLQMKVAKAAEKEFPQEAIKLYRQRAEREIEGRTRGSYQVAASFLKNVKRLYEQLNDRAAWAQYINDLRETHKRFPALQDELQKAGL